MANRRIGGIIFLKVDGELFQAKGSFEYNLGAAKREMVVGSDGVHGYKEVPQVAMISGSVTDNDELDLKKLLETKDATITLELANGKMITLRDAVYTGEGKVTTEEGEIEVKFEGLSAEEVS